jgi:hypothetical protein
LHNQSWASWNIFIQMLRDHPRPRVVCASRCERHDDSEGFAFVIGFRLRACGVTGEKAAAQKTQQKQTGCFKHGHTLSVAAVLDCEPVESSRIAFENL